jgi:hypothetical protein
MMMVGLAFFDLNIVAVGIVSNASTIKRRSWIWDRCVAQVSLRAPCSLFPSLPIQQLHFAVGTAYNTGALVHQSKGGSYEEASQ